jgi:hypothetical protein
MPPDVGACQVRTWIERHRRALARESGSCIDADQWHTGFRAALCDVLINRLATYALIHRVRRQRSSTRHAPMHFPPEGAMNNRQIIHPSNLAYLFARPGAIAPHARQPPGAGASRSR